MCVKKWDTAFKSLESGIKRLDEKTAKYNKIVKDPAAYWAKENEETAALLALKNKKKAKKGTATETVVQSQLVL